MIKTHQTVLEVSLSSLENNIFAYRSKLSDQTMVMAMIKAFGYGVGDVQIAKFMQKQELVAYFGVAYTDEGALLREAGITIPIMVMNPDISEIEALHKYQLQPTIYSKDFLLHFGRHSQPQHAPAVHIKIDSGMHRLGFHVEELLDVMESIKDLSVDIAGVYTHLAATPEPEHDEFTHEQVAYLNRCYDTISNSLGYRPLKHVLNSAGIVRFPEYRYDMVRIGMGMYGLDPAELIESELVPVARFSTIISQINQLSIGETVGYSRKGLITQDKQKIAVLPVGYADGYSRLFSNGNAEVYINGHRAPVFGNVCMDMTFVDVTDLPCKPGDRVELFGQHITIDELAEKAQTITYEILTSIAGRVNRIYS